jgi:hypothetical protein
MISRILWERIGAGFIAFVVVVLFPFRVAPLHAQVAGATLSGTVTDTSGAVIPRAEVSIKNDATELTRTVTTDSAGFYSAPNLLPGSYDVQAASSGFTTEVRTGVTLTVGAQQVLNLTLRVGRTTEKVQVSGEAPAVELATSTISAVVNSTSVRELPLNGRSWTDLTTLQPGVAAIQTQAPLTDQGRGNRGFGAQISVAGARPQQNNYRLDGISINDYSNGGPGSILGGNLGVDAIEEFSVLTSNYSAEYGKTAGGVVNAITRSGTNEFHGTVYEFLRNNALDARNFFDTTIPAFRRNQFGADAGGPIRKDKIFVFGDYEGIRQSKGITNVDTVPSVAFRNGNLCSSPDTTPACKPTTITVDPAAQKYLPFWPLPNAGFIPGTNGDRGTFKFASQQIINENFFTTRVDDRISEKDSLAATYLGDVSPYSQPDALGDVLYKSKTNRQIAIFEETRIFRPTLVNSVRLGYNRESVLNNAGLSALAPLAKDPSLAAVPGHFASSVLISGLTGFSGGLGTAPRYSYFWNSFQVYDDAFWTHGTHSIKFGGAVERMDFNFYSFQSSGGAFIFASPTNFLTNIPSKFSVTLEKTLTGRGVRQTVAGLYLQDDWRARPHLTLNAGLRWEMATVPTEVQGKLSTLANITDPQPICGKLVPGCAATGPFFSNPTLRDFQPRVGFSWDPFHDGKTAVRGGFGVFDALPLLGQFIYLMETAPFLILEEGNSLPPGSFYTQAPLIVSPANARISYVEQHPHPNYVMQWNLNVQREIAPNLTALVGYVGSRGVHELFRVDDLDIVLPTKTSAGWLFPSPVGSGTVINPNFGSMIGVTYRGNSSYNALEVGVQKKMSHGVQLQTSFTWGKSLDTSSGTDHGDQFGNSIATLPWYDINSTRGLSDFNIGRTLVIEGTWQVPSSESLSGVAGWITKGWELGAIYKASDGVPFTATFGTDGDPQGLNSSDPWAFPNRLKGPGCNSLVNPGNPNQYIKTQCFAVPTAPSPAFFSAPSPLGCDPAFGSLNPTDPNYLWCFNLRGNAGRNILIGPGTSNLDFSIFKNNHLNRISENFNVQFRAEFFNILNHTNFAVPITPDNTDIFDSSGASTGVAGRLTSTTTDSRQIQFALKIVW